MRKTGVADLPLHYGKCPRWLFERMTKLSGAITEMIIREYSRDEFLIRISDPRWFQAFGCVLGFDWHSSGVTTTVLGAMKASVKPEDFGIAVLGGKGRASRKTQSELENLGDTFSLSSRKIEMLKYASRMAAKVDNTTVQDSYQLYHHSFLVSEEGKWVVIEQGLNPVNRYARRYHWLSGGVKSFVNEPHEGIVCDRREENVLNMVAMESGEAREASVDLIKDNPARLRGYLTGQATLADFAGQEKRLHMPKSHYIINMDKRNLETLQMAYEIQPESYEELLSVRGVGPKTVRALALVSDLVYGKPANWKDPVKFSFCVGGKDGIPYPVDRETMDKSVEVLRTGIKQARLGNRERLQAIKRLEGFL
jgi:hypothetical protein